MRNLKELEKLIIKHRSLYYQGNPEISDSEYDNLELELKQLDPSNYLFEEVGFKIESSTFEKMSHVNFPMKSLNKAYTRDEMINWYKNFNNEKVICSPKIDGFAISLIDKKTNNNEYVLDKGITRGNGKIGELITDNVKMIKDIPSKIQLDLNDCPDSFEVRGEIYMRKDVFEELKSSGEIKEDSRIRNIAPGSVRQKNPWTTKRRKLNFFAYDCFGFSMKSLSEKLVFLYENLSIPIINFEVMFFSEIEDKYSHYNRNKNNFNYDIDGVVFRINDEERFYKEGETEHHPKGAIAWKFKPEVGQTILKEIKWMTTRTGLINPVGIYDPVEVDGAMLTKATLHNISYIEDLNLNVRDEIEVSRQGGVIPKIQRVIKKNNNEKVEIPQFCPECGQKSTIEQTNQTKTLVCKNDFCSSIMKDKINHFCTVMDMKGISTAIIDKMFEHNHIKTFSDLFKLTERDIISLPGFSEKSSKNVIITIQSNTKKPFDIILRSFGIKGLGKTISRILSDQYSSIDEIKENLVKDVNIIEGLGLESAETIVQTLIDQENEINEIFKFVSIEKFISTGNSLEGMSFCLTGTLSKGRKEYEKMITDNGGKVSSSVNSKLDFLICGENAGSKLEKAKKLNVKILNETEFQQMIDS